MSNVDEFVRQLPFGGSASVAEQRLKQSVRKSIRELLTPEMVEKGIDSFVRTTTVKQNPKFEVLLLTQDNQLFELVFTIEQREIHMGNLHFASEIRSRVYYPAQQEEVFEDEAPYRADLHISAGSFFIQYSAEGDRKSVNSLRNFTEACISAVRRDIQRNLDALKLGNEQPNVT
jgi:hypothetical protein